jgi:hypothetical protein
MRGFLFSKLDTWLHSDPRSGFAYPEIKGLLDVMRGRVNSVG